MHKKLFSLKFAKQYHIHVVTVKGVLAHLVCLLSVARCEKNN